MKIGFFGGSFNPPTIAHLNLAKQAVKEYNLDKLYFVPVNNHYIKKDLIDIDLRIQMLESICLYEDKLLVSNIEKINDTKLEEIDIFKIIKSQYKNDETFFIMGEDNYEKMPKWKDYEDLKKFKYIVFQRKEEPVLHNNYENVFYIKNQDNLKISSSIIRNKVHNNEAIDGYVTNNIKKFIIKNNLYNEG